GLALHRAEPHGEGRQTLLQKFESNENLVTMCSTEPTTDVVHGSPPEFGEAQRQGQVGFSDLFEEEKTFNPTVRRQVLSYKPQKIQQATACSTPFSFSFQLAYRFLSQQGRQPTVTEDSQGWKFGETVIGPLPRRFGGYQTLGGNTLELLLDYRNVEEQPAQQITVDDVLNRTIMPELVRDRIILIGNNNRDLDPPSNTPYGPMPAVWTQAHMTSQLIDIGLGIRALFWALPQWQDALIVGMYSILGGTLAYRFRSRKVFLLTLVVALLLWQQTCLGLLIRGGWLPFVPATLSLLVTSSITRYSQSKS
ncbi:MAG: CHASE2 domain-containing protein, partial [Moorea sp. SIO3C2]|nr:CHASE2 domain-containing protein [Moorena sp. SIO3C2]